MKPHLMLVLLLTCACSPKKQMSVFDSNMLVRTADETEILKEEISVVRKQCEENKFLIQNELADIPVK